MNFIYIITNNITTKKYVGVATDVQKRWLEHINRHKSLKYNSSLYASMRKHGVGNFSIETIFCTFKESDAYEMEPYFISNIGTKVPMGYNIDNGGRGGNKVKDGNRILRSLKTGEIKSSAQIVDEEWVGLNKGIRVIKIDGREFRVQEKDQIFIDYSSLVDKILSSGLEPMESKLRHGLYKDENGNRISLPSDHPDVISKKVKGHTSGKVLVKYFHTGETKLLENDHIDIKEGKCTKYCGNNKVVSDGIRWYGSATEAARVYCHDPIWIHRRCSKLIEGWFYVDKPFG